MYNYTTNQYSKASRHQLIEELDKKEKEILDLKRTLIKATITEILNFNSPSHLKSNNPIFDTEKDRAIINIDINPNLSIISWEEPDDETYTIIGLSYTNKIFIKTYETDPYDEEFDETDLYNEELDEAPDRDSNKNFNFNKKSYEMLDGYEACINFMAEIIGATNHKLNNAKWDLEKDIFELTSNDINTYNIVDNLDWLYNILLKNHQNDH